MKKKSQYEQILETIDLDGSQGLYHFILAQLSDVIVTYVEGHMEHDDIYGYVSEIGYRLSNYTEYDPNREIEIGMLFDELTQLDLGMFNKSINQAAIVYSVFVAHRSQTDSPQLYFSGYNRRGRK